MRVCGFTIDIEQLICELRVLRTAYLFVVYGSWTLTTYTLSTIYVCSRKLSPSNIVMNNRNWDSQFLLVVSDVREIASNNDNGIVPQYE